MDSLEDFSKKYRQTYVRLRNKDGRLLTASVDRIDMDQHLVSFNVDALGLLTLKYPACMSEINTDLPEAGLFNYNGHALHLFKMPARQWQRGLCGANHEIYNPLKKLLSEGMYRAIITRGSVEAIWKRDFVSVDEAVARMTALNRGPSVAITLNLMLSKSPTAQADPLVWYKTTPVGFVKNGKFLIEDEIYQQEVHDELNRLGANRWNF